MDSEDSSVSSRRKQELWLVGNFILLLCCLDVQFNRLFVSLPDCRTQDDAVWRNNL